MNTVFVTGTDTGVGKTHVSCALLQAARARGIRACGYKPVASGCTRAADGRLYNDDALALQAAAGTDEAYEAINPYAFEPPLAPHLAAALAGQTILRERLDRGADALAARHEWLLVEGAGGWQVPLDETSGFAEWVAARGWPVLLVVGMRLGCISHALLTAESIRHSGARLLGWVANELPPAQDALEGNIATLQNRLGVPLLGRLPASVVHDPAGGAALLETLLHGLLSQG